jgi:hypothetical protein
MLPTHQLGQILDRPIAYHRAFVSLRVGVTGAVLLSQAIYWSQRTKDKDGWFFKTQVDWEDETGLTRREQEGARKKLRSAGVLEEKRKGVPARLFYRVDFAKLWEKLSELSAPDDTPPDQNAQKRQSTRNRGVEAKNEGKSERTSKDAPNRQSGMAQSAGQDAPKPPDPYTETTPEITSDYTERECARPDLDNLENKLFKAGGEALANPVSAPNLLTLSEPLRWIEQGCDLQQDILPTIKARAARATPGMIRTWSYFTQAVVDAKARREQPLPEATSTSRISHEPDWRREKRERSERHDFIAAEIQRRVDAGLSPLPEGGFANG